MTKLILKCSLSPGDIVMLTAAVRDLHRCHPGRFVTDVRTSCPDLWRYNPWLTPLRSDDPEVRHIECRYPLIDRANSEPWHFLHGFVQHLGGELGVSLHPTAFRGDIHLSKSEMTDPGPVEEVHGDRRPYWIIAAGGKYDFTIKWWHRRRWQEVVNRLRDEVVFVQVGEAHHYHPRLEGVVDMRGRTTLRELVRLVYHSRGVVCPVTSLMHLAAAVPQPPDRRGERPCVVVAGAREPAHWEAYPWHRYLHTVGTLPCCASGGCWKRRSVPLGDGDCNDDPERLCLDFDAGVGLPRCMASIEAPMVIQSVRAHLPARQVQPITIYHE
ncbi:MAG: ADP-heptose--LPS heptosyltransferase [Verrucomicrobiae bacterium]|nr:ADP-heptose--LPS heptosyltransferase [Verrucomicrobiae bacterium]